MGLVCLKLLVVDLFAVTIAMKSYFRKTHAIMWLC